MRAIQLQELVQNPVQAPQKKNASTQTEPNGEMQNVSTQTEPNESAEDNDHNDTKINNCLLLLSHLHTKVDALGAQQFQQPGTSGTSSIDCVNVELAKLPFNPVKSLGDLESLEERCHDKKFVAQAVASIGKIYGRGRFTNQGATVSLRLVDYFFNRKFLISCSWTGATRTSGNEKTKKQKIPFMKFDKTIDLFYQTVLFSDPVYTKDECESFLHRCLKNALQRYAEVSGTRKPASRKRKRLTPADHPGENEDEEDSIEDGGNNELGDKGLGDHFDGNSSWQMEVLDIEKQENDENLPPN